MRHALLHRLLVQRLLVQRLRVHRLLAISIIAAGLGPAPALAQAPKAATPAGAAKAVTPPKAAKAAPPAATRAEPVPFSLAFDRTITLHADRTAESVNTARIKILGEAALRSMGQQTLSYIEGVQTLDVVEAYTEKTDGSRVDPASIITRDQASGLNAVYLRDAKARIMIFPDLAVAALVAFAGVAAFSAPAASPPSALARAPSPGRGRPR